MEKPQRGESEIETIPNLHVLAKSSESCPLNCRYCYVGSKPSLSMSESVLEQMIKLFSSRKNPKSIDYTWHGSEPLSVGIPFFKRAVELQKRYHLADKVRNSVQTSGVLITPEYADFLVENNFSVGFSLDGPGDIQNYHRPFASGGESFDRVMNAIELMRERGQKPGAIAVITKRSLPHLDRIYDFFKQNNLGFKVNPMFVCGNAQENERDLALTVDERTRALNYLFDKWFDDSSPESDLHTFSGLVKAVFAKSASSCDLSYTCQENFLGVGAKGEIYPCSRYSSDDVSYGNIMNISDFREIANNPIRKKLLNRPEMLSECSKCPVQFMCYGGCMHNAYVAGDIMQKDPNCRSNKKFYIHIINRLHEQLEKDKAFKKSQGGQEVCQV